MDLKKIKNIINIVEEAKISSLSLEEDGFKIEIKKEFTPANYQVSLPQELQFQQRIISTTDSQATSQNKIEPAVTKIADNLFAVKSPMVGTFYNTPNPDSPPYVRIGDTVKEGQVVCIIEAMKIFNEIETECSGVIEKICVESGTPVEYGQDLFLIKKA